ncbi:MAG: secondary thiamine-phosphate synthase enzyme YjbQ [Oscillospiraceae bacterium]|jgi:secondary thiamine-phosphate synthase enzyme|nr:secondary thiamine-phosphate synthase enzyme YjbQ [Oscillospiraceae bacterium]
MTYEFTLKTPNQALLNITAQVTQAVRDSGVAEGRALVYCPHTTAGVTINENADPDVTRDLLLGLDKAFPDRPEFRHAEGNAAAHLKATCVGASASLIIKGGRPLLGTWQGVYFCEFDGPRTRTFYVQVAQA